MAPSTSKFGLSCILCLLTVCLPMQTAIAHPVKHNKTMKLAKDNKYIQFKKMPFNPWIPYMTYYGAPGCVADRIATLPFEYRVSNHSVDEDYCYHNPFYFPETGDDPPVWSIRLRPPLDPINPMPFLDTFQYTTWLRPYVGPYCENNTVSESWKWDGKTKCLSFVTAGSMGSLRVARYVRVPIRYAYTVVERYGIGDIIYQQKFPPGVRSNGYTTVDPNFACDERLAHWGFCYGHGKDQKTTSSVRKIVPLQIDHMGSGH